METQESQKVAPKKKRFTGVVVSNKMKDTVVVEINRFQKVPKYQKYINITKRLMAHNPGNTKKVGETVEIEETRPMSKNKYFRVM